MDSSSRTAGDDHLGSPSLDALCRHRPTPGAWEIRMVIAQEACFQKSGQVFNVCEVVDEAVRMHGRDGHGDPL